MSSVSCQDRGGRGGQRHLTTHLCARAVLGSPAHSPLESSGCIWSRCCPSLHRQHSSQTGHRHKSSPRRTSAEWHASTTQAMHRGTGTVMGKDFKGSPCIPKPVYDEASLAGNQAQLRTNGREHGKEAMRPENPTGTRDGCPFLC